MVKVRIENETPHEKFIRIVTPRTQRVLESLRILGNCANPQIYEYTQQEVDKIIKSIKSAIEEVKRKFDYNLKKKNEKFQL